MDTNFWERVRVGFTQLRADCAINPPNLTAGRLMAVWAAQLEPGRWRWRLEHWNKKDGNGVTERFKWLAQSAAARLGFAGAGDDAVSFWLDQIKLDAPESHLREIFVEGEESNQLYAVEILDICGLSADLCWKCEADEIRPQADRVESSGLQAIDPFQEDASSKPLGDNPFPQDHPAHSAFEEATWKAKGAIAKLKLELLGTNFNTRAEFIQSLSTFRKRWFTATAFEATLIVGNEETAQWYEQWIDGHAEWFLEDSLKQFKAKDPKADPLNPPFFNPADLENIEIELKLELMRMVAHYKGVAAARIVKVIGLRNAAKAAAAAELKSTATINGRDVTEMASLNLTDQQKDLLRLLVSMHESSGGAEFKFVRSLTSSGLSYPGGMSVPVENDNTDFRRLERENLIDFTCTGTNLYSGKPTQLGITFVRRGFALFEAGAVQQVDPAKVKSAFGRNVDRLRKECGWSFDDLAKATDLGKKLILGHVNEGKGAHPKTLEIYARTFTEKMGRPVTVAELES